ncbi:hypothetical protein EAI75_10450, partial [Bifidobacterium longum]
TQRRQAAADTAHPAENPLPTLRKNTAHKADANLLKHNRKRDTRRVAYPVREVIAWGEQNGLQQQTVAA